MKDDRLLRFYLRELIKESYDETGGWVVTSDPGKAFADAFLTPWANYAKLVGGEALRVKSTAKLVKDGLFNSIKATLGHGVDWNKPFKVYDEEIKKIKELPWYKEGLEQVKDVIKSDVGMALALADPGTFLAMKAAESGKSVEQIKESAKEFWDEVNLRSPDARKGYDKEMSSLVQKHESYRSMNAEQFQKATGVNVTDGQSMVGSAPAISFDLQKWINSFPYDKVKELGDKQQVMTVLQALQKNKLLIESSVKSKVLQEAPAAPPAPKTPAAPAPSVKIQEILNAIKNDVSKVPPETVRKVVEYFVNQKKVGKELYQQKYSGAAAKVLSQNPAQNLKIAKESLRDGAIKDLQSRLNGLKGEDPQMQTYMTKKIKETIEKLRSIKY